VTGGGFLLKFLYVEKLSKKSFPYKLDVAKNVNLELKTRILEKNRFKITIWRTRYLLWWKFAINCLLEFCRKFKVPVEKLELLPAYIFNSQRCWKYL